MRPLINITRNQALWFAFFLVSYEFLTYIANDMIMPGMLQVVNSFQSSEVSIARSLTAYMLGGASLQLILGPLSDRYGRRPVMIFGSILFFFCTAFIAASFSMDSFIAARFFQGMGLCFISVIGYATLQEIFAEMDAIRLISVMANVSICAPLLGPLLGAVFISFFSWRWIFIIIAFLALIVSWGLWRFMPEPVGKTTRGGQKLERIPLSFKVVVGNYKKLIKNGPFLIGSLALGFSSIQCLAWIALSPIILISQSQLSSIEYGLWQIPIFGAAILGNWYLRKLTHDYSVKTILLWGGLITSCGILLITLLPIFANGDYRSLMPGFILYFFGLGVGTAPLNRFLLFSTSVAKGTASALMTMIAMFIQSLGIEGANHFYTATNSNYTFGYYCGACGLIYITLIFVALSMQEDKAIPNSPGN